MCRCSQTLGVQDARHTRNAMLGEQPVDVNLLVELPQRGVRLDDHSRVTDLATHRQHRAHLATDAPNDLGNPQVIPEGAGRVNPRVMTRFYPIPGSVQTSAGEGSGSRLDRRATRAAGLALTPAPIGACLHRAGNDSCEVVSGRVLHRPLWTVWRNRSVRLPVIPSPPTWGGMEWYGRGQAESIRVVDRATGGGSDLQRPRVLAAPEGRSRRSGQATDVSVAQRVVDQGEQLAGGGDLGDVRASAFGQPGPGTPDRTAVETLHRFDGGPADQMVALLGDAATVDGGVGLTVAGSHAGPGAQLLGPTEPAHVADRGQEHRAQHRPDPGDGLHRLEPGVAGELAAGALGQNVDLEGERVDEPAKREHAGVERGVQGQLVKQRRPADTEQV